jgi:hypothetical protein
MVRITPKLRQTSADDEYVSAPKKTWDCGCHRHLEAGSEEELIAKVIYHLAVQHPEAHHTLEQADELVAAQAYAEPSWGGVFMLSEEALVGTRVRVRDSLLRADLRGLEGTITRRWGHPEYVALDVLLGDGRTQLFWHHELEEHNGVA